MGTHVPRTVDFALRGRMPAGESAAIYTHVCRLLEKSEAEVAFCDVGAADPDAVTVEALARAQLAARRHGCRMRLWHESPEMRWLIAFMGLDEVLEGSLRVEAEGQSEEREQGAGVQEERDLSDAAGRELEDL